MRWRFGNFSLVHKPKPLTSNRTVEWSDNAGVVDLEPLYQTSVTSIVPLNRKTVMAPLTITGQYQFGPSSSGDIVGGTCTYRLTANGANSPTFAAGLTESSLSTGYDGRVGIVNTISFWFDGTTRWYSISQAVGQQPAWFSVGVTFPTRGGTATITQDVQSYFSNSTVFMDAWMTSAQSIPANKAGRLVVRVDSDQLIGLHTTATSVLFSSMLYRAFSFDSSALFYTDSVAGPQIVHSTVPVQDLFVRFSRSSAGVVTVETSLDQVTWLLRRTYGDTTLAELYIHANLTGTPGGTRRLDFISFEVGA